MPIISRKANMYVTREQAFFALGKLSGLLDADDEAHEDFVTQVYTYMLQCEEEPR